MTARLSIEQRASLSSVPVTNNSLRREPGQVGMGVTAVVVNVQFAVDVGACPRRPLSVSCIHHRLKEYFAVGFECWGGRPIITRRQRRPEGFRAEAQSIFCMTAVLSHRLNLRPTSFSTPTSSKPHATCRALEASELASMRAIIE